MSTMQVSVCGPHVKVKNISPSLYLPVSQLRISPTYASRLPGTCPMVPPFNVSSYRRCTPVCLFGGKGTPKNDNEGSPWKDLEKAMGGLRKEKSVQDMLREQMQKREFDDNGGGAGSPPGGGGDGSGGSEDEGFSSILDELLQVTLATIGLIFVYIYILEGEDITRLAKDCIIYLFTRKKSIRLRQTMYQCKKFYDSLTRKDVVEDKYWLERAIINTPTWWHNPSLIKRLARSRLASAS